MKKRLVLLVIFILLAINFNILVLGQSAVGLGLTLTGQFDSDGDGIPDDVDDDDDNDGIPDDHDFLIGNLSYINPYTHEAINISINNSINFTQVFNGTHVINISNATNTLVEIDWVFNATNIINLRNISINKTTVGSGAIEIHGISIKYNTTKRFYIDKVNLTVNAICVKDSENATIRSISSSCNSIDEKLLICDGTPQSGYTCDNLGDRYKLSGLNHSSGKELCIDNDGDGYGTGCAAGNDCNDNDRTKTTNCATDTQDTGGGAAGGGGGGGGGGGPSPITIKTDFSIDKITLKVVLKQGQTKTETLSIKNTGTTIFDVRAFLSGISKFKIAPESDEVVTLLNPNEEKTIELTFKALENEVPDIYPAKIVLQSPSTKKEIDTVIEVDSAEPLFDVDVEVLSETKKIFPGEELLLEVNLFNVRGFGRVDVSVEYSIKDFSGNTVATEHETLAIETQAKFTRALLVPSDLRPGNYVALVKVTYADSIGTSSDVFEVKAKAIRLSLVQLKDYRVILLLGVVVVIVGIFIFSAYQMGYLKKKMPKAPVEELKQLREEEKAQKLKKELEALEQARKSGFISEESYQKDKKRIEDKLKSLK